MRDGIASKRRRVTNDAPADGNGDACTFYERDYNDLARRDRSGLS
jgi:hypothetical protein